jgi:Family of unknown function (DUF6427)
VISIFRDKSIISIFALVFCTLLVHLHIFNQPVQILTTANSGVFSWVLKTYSFKLHSSIITVLYIALLFIQALRLNYILSSNKMYAKDGFTIAFAYILLSGLLINEFALSAAFLANSLIILLYAIIIKLYNNQQAKALLFNVGFLAATTVICYYPFAFVLPIVFFALAILRPFKIAEWFILLLGIIAPFYLLLGIMYLCNFNFYSIVLPKILFYIRFQQNNVWYYINFFAVMLLMLAAFISWYPNSNKLVIQIRKNWVVMLLLLLLTTVTIFMFTKSALLPDVICLVPMAAFLANFFVYPKKTVIINILIAIVSIIIIYNNNLVWK